MRFSLAAVLSVASLSLQILPTYSLINYANVFIDPRIVVFSNINTNAQVTIVKWAEDLALMGPWSVTNKSHAAPSGDIHDYMSWAPYWWPDCSNVGNTTELTPEQIWATCPYVSRDGQFNPDGRIINDIGEVDDLANAVLYNSLAWAIKGSSVYSANVVKWINTWFLDPATLMNPNLNYAQMQRGPTGQNGTHTGILDLKSMTKIVSGVLILREGKAPEWTAEVDSGLTAWVNKYIAWLESAEIALEEKASTNNHGSFYFNQLAALQVLVNDTAGTKTTLQGYFEGNYMNQISANGDQPLESTRTRPYHYRAYNLAAMITNAKLGSYVGYDAWDIKTSAGTNIQDALNYAMTLPPGDDAASELWPDILAVGAHFGDADLKYANFLLKNAGSAYPSDPTFLWDQPFSDMGLVKAPTTSASNAGASTSTSTSTSTSKSTSTSTSKSKSKSKTEDTNGAGTLRASGSGALAIGVLALALL